ncbi:replication protein P, partial [Escherichia coli EC4421]
MKNIA